MLKDWGLRYVTGCDAVWFSMCYNPKIIRADSDFSDDTFHLNTCRRLQIWTVDIDMNWILLILCTPRRLLYAVGTLSTFPEIKGPGHVADHSLPRSTEIMNEWSCASNPPVPQWLDGKNFTSYVEQGWGENNCGHFLAGTVQYKYSRFTCCHVQDSNSFSGKHKPHTLPLM